VGSQNSPATQSAFVEQATLQVVALAQAKWFGQAVAVCAQEPPPSQARVVRVLPLHDAVPQLVPVEGYAQAPSLVQSVAPQVASPVAQEVAQQCPVPVTPQIIERHALSEVQAAPFGSPAVPPVVFEPPVVVVPPVVVEPLVATEPLEGLQPTARRAITLVAHALALTPSSRGSCPVGCRKTE
jgi:hypothetical protein